ncbi:MAG: membrane protein insertion efficiency factor YidD [Verrucomicrobia bacterium]|nr:membrane protein insertion efficiency factor YidD [Verrucomicrobiota bacterium]
MSEPRPSVLAWLALGLVRFYQRFLSKPLHLIPGSGCRYHPTCSCYTATALARFGFFKGGWMGLRRICRCHPWGGSGIDEVPER